MAIEIFALGDGAYMSKILNGIAMFPDYGVWAVLGGMFAILAYVHRMFTQADLNPTPMVLGWVFFSVLFTVRVDEVLVHEVVPHLGASAPQSYVVDNVPLGAVMGGGLISHMGVAMGLRLEQVMGGASDENRISTGGLGRNLKLLMNIRQIGSPQLQDERGILHATRTSLANYLRDCTLPGVTSDPSMLSRLYRGDAIEGMAFRNDYRTTTIQTVNASGIEEKSMTCANAHAALASTFNGTAVCDAVNSAMSRLDALATVPSGRDRIGGAWQSLLGKPAARSTGGGCEGGYVGDVMGAYASFNRPITGSGQQLVAAHMVNAVRLEAMVQGGLSGNDIAAVLMVEEAAMARNTQAVAEENLFVRYLRPSVAFFESWFYALFPFASFLVMLGRFGWSLISKYILFSVSVALWWPILAIVNLYGVTQMEHFFAAMNTDLATSVVGVHQISQQAQDALGFTATLVASTPMLALMVVFGTPTLGGMLAQRLPGGDMVNERIAAPSATQPAPVMQATSAISSSATIGTAQTDAPSIAPEVTTGQVVSAMMASSSGYVQSASEQLSKSLSNGLSFLQQVGQTFGVSVGGSTQVNSGTGTSIDTSRGTDLSSSAGTGSSTTDSRSTGRSNQVTDQSGMSVEGGGAIPKALPINGGIAVRGGVTTSETESTSQESSYREVVERGMRAGASSSERLAAAQAIQDQIAIVTSGSQLSSAQEAEARTLQEQLSSSITQVKSAEESYREATTLQSSIQTSESLNSFEMSNRILQGWEAEANARGVDVASYVEGRVSAMYDRVGAMGLDSELAAQHSRVSALTSDATYGSSIGLAAGGADAQRDVMAVIHTLMGSNGAASPRVVEVNAGGMDDRDALWRDVIRQSFVGGQNDGLTATDAAKFATMSQTAPSLDSLDGMALQRPPTSGGKIAATFSRTSEQTGAIIAGVRADLDARTEGRWDPDAAVRSNEANLTRTIDALRDFRNVEHGSKPALEGAITQNLADLYRGLSTGEVSFTQLASMSLRPGSAGYDQLRTELEESPPHERAARVVQAETAATERWQRETEGMTLRQQAVHIVEAVAEGRIVPEQVAADLQERWDRGADKSTFDHEALRTMVRDTAATGYDGTRVDAVAKVIPQDAYVGESETYKRSAPTAGSH